MDFEVYYIICQRPKRNDTIVDGPYYSMTDAISNLDKFHSNNFHRDYDYKIMKTTLILSQLNG